MRRLKERMLTVLKSKLGDVTSFEQMVRKSQGMAAPRPETRGGVLDMCPKCGDLLTNHNSARKGANATVRGYSIIWPRLRRPKVLPKSLVPSVREG